MAVRRIRLIGVLVTVTGTAVAVSSCSSGSTTASTSPTPPPTVSASTTATASVKPPAHASPTHSPTPTASPLDIPADHKDFGYVTAIKHRNGTAYLVFDRAVFYTGDAANKAAATDGMETPVPNDYYIVNKNKKLRELPVTPSARVYESIAMGHAPPDDNVRGPFSDLEKFFASQPDRAKITPFHLHYDARDRVDTVTEQYVP